MNKKEKINAFNSIYLARTIYLKLLFSKTKKK